MMSAAQHLALTQLWKLARTTKWPRLLKNKYQFKGQFKGEILMQGGNLIIVIYSRTIVTPLYNCKGNLRKNLKEKNMRTKNKTLTIAGFEPIMHATP
jgi:hypothetical protein